MGAGLSGTGPKWEYAAQQADGRARRYPSSLKQWRLKQPEAIVPAVPLYLNVYAQILDAAAFMHAKRVTHYDLKCDNVFIELLHPDTPEAELWAQPCPAHPPTRLPHAVAHTQRARASLRPLRCRAHAGALMCTCERRPARRQR